MFTGSVPDRKGEEQTVQLFEATQVKIRRHTKIQGNANPYDPSWELYLEERLTARMKDTQAGRWQTRVLWEAQGGKCPRCNQKMTPETGWETHHRQWRVYGGTDLLENVELLHPNCHRQIHSRTMQGTQAASREGVREGLNCRKGNFHVQF